MAERRVGTVELRRGSYGREKRKREDLRVGGVQNCLWSYTLRGWSLEKRRREDLLLSPQTLPASPQQRFPYRMALGEEQLLEVGAWLWMGWVLRRGLVLVWEVMSER